MNVRTGCIVKDKQKDISADEFFAVHKDTIPYLKSYLLAQQDNVSAKIRQIRHAQPDLPLTKVVTTILNDLPENMAARLVRELTLFIIEEWENNSTSTLEEPSGTSTPSSSAS